MKQQKFIYLVLITFFISESIYSQVTNSQTYSTNGTYSFTVPTGVTQVWVECWGGGGRGSRVTTDGGFASGGGGGGAYSKKLVTVVSGSSNTVRVGAGSANTAAGGDSYFISTGTVMAKGGNSLADNTTTGALGGDAASSVGDTKKSGGNGANGNYTSRYGGGGGSSAGTNSDGANGLNATGGNAPSGGGNGGNGRNSTQGVGTIGSSPGGGGGGALSTSNSNFSPGSGANGQVKITWCVPISITGTTANNTCLSDGTSTVTLTGNAANLPTGTYTVTYNRSNPAATGLTATMVVTTAGTGTFTADGFSSLGSSTVTITNLASDICSWTVSSNNSATIEVINEYSIIGTDATNSCDETSIVTLTSSATGLPIGTYTVTYNRSSPSATSLTASMTVSSAGTGTFTATGFSTLGNSTITVTQIAIGSCSSIISSNNTKTITVSDVTFSLSSISASNACPSFGETTVSITSSASGLPTGNYTVTYNRSSPAATGLTANMTVTTAGSGIFTATGFTNAGSPTITVTDLASGGCTNVISSNNIATVTVNVFSLTSTTATNTCDETSSVTLNSSAAGLPIGSYTVTYNRSTPTATGLTASMEVTTAGTGTFTATGFTNAGNSTITITGLAMGSCTNTISSNNTKTIAVTTYSLTSTAATNPCDGNSTVTLTNSTASKLPVGTYTVTYNRSSPAATGLTATMVVTTAGTGSFTASGFTTAGNSTITITNLANGSCNSTISSSNAKTVTVTTYTLTGTSATNSCNESSTVTLTNTTTSKLPTGTYTVTYNRSSPAATGLTASMTVTTAGTGTFTATGFTIPGNSTITVTNLAKSGCNSDISSNNTSTITVTTFSLTGIDATNTCNETSTVSLTSSAAQLPTGTYTVTYDISSPATAGKTATMVVTTAGSGTFTATGFTVDGSSTITVKNLLKSGCNSNLSSNNTKTITVSTFSLTGTDATNTCDGNSTVTLTSSSSQLPTGTYTVTYDRSSPVATGLTATMTINSAGTGTFTATGFTSSGNSIITIKSLAKSGCSSTISSNNTKTISVSTFSLTGTTATNSCNETSTVTITSSASQLPIGNYTVTYNRSSPAATGLTASMNVTTAGTGDFTAIGFTSSGNSTITITKLENGICNSSISSNNSKTITVSTYSLTSTSASPTCPTSGETNVTLTSSAAQLPVGTYTVTYNRSAPVANNLTAIMTVATAGTGTFTGTGFTQAGSPTITITKLTNGSCFSNLSSNNTTTVLVDDYSLTSTTATTTCSGTTTVSVTAPTSKLPIGTYTVTYNRSAPVATSLTATMIVTVSGSGSFLATGYTTNGTQSVTITNIATSNCSYDISSNNTANFNVSLFKISNLSAGSTCASVGTPSVSITAAAVDLPVGTYTVTYNRSAPAAAGLTASMTVSTAGSGTFTASGFSTNGQQTITVTNLSIGSCSTPITENNTATVDVTYYFTSANTTAVCTNDGTTLVTLNSTAIGLPTGKYTVAWSRSTPAGTGTTIMYVNTAGYGQFGVGGFTTAGTQTITITQLILTSGCSVNLSANNSFTVDVNSSAPAQPSVISGLTYSCEGSSQSYSVDFVSGVTYQWAFPSEWVQTAGGTSNSVTATVGDNGGIIRVIPFNGCTGTPRSLTISQLSPEITISHLSSPCSKDGSITVNTSGGSGNYSYEWSIGTENTNSRTDLFKGIYYVTITDETTSCTKTFENVVGTNSYNNTCDTKDGTASASGIINSYYPPASSGTVPVGSTSITLGTVYASGSTTNFSAGDLALFIQMQGATMDTSATSSWGALSNIIAGQYEYVKVTSFNSGTGVLNLSSPLLYSYIQNKANGYTFQVIRVPQYFDLTLTGNLNVLAWRGNNAAEPSVGGVLAIDVANILNMNGYTINGDYAGFRGGGGYSTSGSSLGKNVDFSFYSASNGHGFKGEGIAGSPKFIYNGSALVQTGTDYPHNKGKGRGAPGNAGGGGNDADVSANDENSGGGGGANLTWGGIGGCPWRSDNFLKDVGGRGGKPLAVSPLRLIMGGGGGAGSSNNGFVPHGGNGGGIIILHTKHLTGTGTLSVNGRMGSPGSPNTGNDAGGGGGGGGTVLLTYETSNATLTINANGGRGSDALSSGAGLSDSHGPGGGGSGGAIFTNAGFLSGSITYNINGGMNGITTVNNIPYESRPGDNGVYRCTVADELTTSIFSRDCLKDAIPPTLGCPSITTCCAGSVPATYGTISDYTNAGGTASDDISGLNCIVMDEETGSEASGTISRKYVIVDQAGNRSECFHEISVKPIPNAGISGTTSVYMNDPEPNVTFTNSTSYNATVTYEVNAAKAQYTINVPANSTADLTVPTNVPGVYEYKIVNIFYQIVPSCTNVLDPLSAPSAIVTVISTLPVELLYLKATKVYNGVNVNWSTATEINNDFFIVQRSPDGINFKNIDTLDGAGNSNSLRSYSCLDRNPLKGTSYYRLKQVDFDGVFNLSNTVSVTDISESNSLNLYPNPIKRGEYLNLYTENNRPESKTKVVLKNNNSKIVESFDLKNDSNGNLFFKFKIDSEIQAGIYFIEIYNEGKVSASKIIVSN